MKPKPHLDWENQLLRLKDRGLLIEDNQFALQTLKTINLYRLRGYFHVFLDHESTGSDLKQFKPQTRIDDVVALVAFDTRLRGLLFEVLSQFELSLRTNFAYHGGRVDPRLHVSGEGLSSQFLSLDFNGNQDHTEWLQEYKNRVKRMGSEEFVRWHLETYNGELPIWVAVEILDFGALSKLFRSTSQGLSHSIAGEYGCTPTLLKSWTSSLNDLRNCVAHQNRLWNSVYPRSPKTIKRQIPPELLHLDSQNEYDRTKIYSRLAILCWLDQGNRFGVDFKNRLLHLLSTFPVNPHIGLGQMGFPEDWGNLKIWK